MQRILPKSNTIELYRKLTTLKMNNNNQCIVAVCQFTATNNKENNLKIVKNLVDRAVKSEAKIIFLPECCDFIAKNKHELKSLAEPLSGPIMTEYKKLAKDLNIWLSVGGFHELSNDIEKPQNSHILINNDGNITSIYRKLHLFDVSIPEKNINLRESEIIEKGKEILPPIQTPAGNLSLSVCYDMRFPELSIMQRKLGAEILTYPSAFTNATGKLHWESLLKARAIENQCYVIAAAQYGRHNDKRISYGQSLIVDPWGTIIAECPSYKEGIETDESVAVAKIDQQLLEKVRNEMPVFQHRRSDCYQLKILNECKYLINDDELYYFADKIIPGSTIFYRTPFSFAFTNIRCVVPGHVLISSIRPAKRLENLTSDEISDLFLTVVKVQKVMEKIYKTTSTTIVVQDGEDAGQTVPHVHVHILPRKKNDFNRNDDIYDHLAKHDRDNSDLVALRSVEEMSNEAKNLRKFFD